MTSNILEQNKPEPPESWEEEFDELWRRYDDNCKFAVGYNNLKAFIRKVAQQARQEALEEAVRALEAAYNCGDQCLDNAIEDVKSLLTNPKDK